MSKITDLNLEDVLDRIEKGETYREIGRALKIDAGDLCRALNANEEIAQRSAQARETSAEAWLDRGLEYCENAETFQEIARARIVAQECARRAAVRNPKYNDRVRVEHAGSVKMSVTINAEDSGVL